MLDKKSFKYSSQQSFFTIKDQNAVIMTGQLNFRNLYRVDLGADASLSLLLTYAMIAIISKLPTDITTWHRRFANQNQTYLKRFFSITYGMKILAKSAAFLFCRICVESKMTRQTHRNAQTPSDILGYYIHVDAGESANAYETWKSYWYFMLLVDDATRATRVRFMKKKSDVLTVFRDFVLMLEKHYNIQVCIINTNFGGFNSDAAAEYFSHTGII